MEKSKSVGIEVKYSDLSNFHIDSTLARMAEVITDGHSAYKIKKMCRAVNDAKKKIAAEYDEEIVKKFSKKDESGNVIRVQPEKDPLGFVPDDEQKEGLKDAFKAFGEKTVWIDRPALSLHDLRDMPMSALDQDSLKNLIDDTEAERGHSMLARVK